MSFKLNILQKSSSLVVLNWAYNKLPEDVFKVELRYGQNDWKMCYWGTKTTTRITDLEINLCFTFRVIVLRLNRNTYEPVTCSEEAQVYTLSDISIGNFHRSIQKHQPYIVKQVVANKLEYINMPGKCGISGLAFGVLYNNEDAVRLLLEYGANVNVQIIESKRTPIMLAISTGNLKIAKALMEKRPNINMQDKNLMTAAHFAVDSNSIDSLKFCIDNGSNLELKDICGWTVFLRAVVMHCDINIILLLLETGIDVTLVDNNKLSCLDHAKLQNRNGLTEILMNQPKIIKVQN